MVELLNDGQFDMAWDVDMLVEPTPCIVIKPELTWNKFLRNLCEIWDGIWANPVK